jgi:hypothetical protein
MRTIFKAGPLLRLHDRGPAVQDVQELLNKSDRDGTKHIWSKTDFLEEDGKFGPLTLAKVREFQTKFGLQVDGIVGPKTKAELFAPQADRVDQAQGIAINWTLIAKGAIQSLQNYVRVLQFGGPKPTDPILSRNVDALATHFRIFLPRPTPLPLGMPKPPGSGSANPLDLIDANDRLGFIFGVYDDVGFVLDQASIREGRVFQSIGRNFAEAQRAGLSTKSATTGDINHDGTILVNFPPAFAETPPGLPFFRTIHQQASTVLHECCHYVRPGREGPNHVEDFAYGLPPFAGKAAKPGGHNYQQLTADEALHNAESYNLFAENVVFGADTRFGRFSSDLTTFECGTLGTFD